MRSTGRGDACFSFITTLASQRRVNGGSASACERSARSSTVSPLQTSHQAHFVDRDRRIGFRRPRIADEDDLVFGVGAGQEPGGTIVEQQNDRSGAANGEQMPPAQPQGAGPHAGVLRPGGQCRGGRASSLLGPSGTPRDRVPVRSSGPPSSSRAGAGGSARGCRRRSPIDMPAPAVPPP